jgi:hypothetical protein
LRAARATIQFRNRGIHRDILGALGHEDGGQDPLIHRFHFHGRLIGFDLGNHVTGFHLVAGLLQPAGQLAFRHGGGKRGHQDYGSHLS